MSMSLSEEEYEKQREEYEKLKLKVMKLLEENGYGAEFKRVWSLKK